MPIDIVPSIGNADDFRVVDSSNVDIVDVQDLIISDEEGYVGGSGSGIWPDTILLLEDYDLVEAYFPPRQ